MRTLGAQPKLIAEKRDAAAPENARIPARNGRNARFRPMLATEIFASKRTGWDSNPRYAQWRTRHFQCRSFSRSDTCPEGTPEDTCVHA